MQDVSASGFVATVQADVTFPGGFEITAFADDTDPFDMASVQIGQSAMNMNGDLVTWSSPVPITAVLALIPGSPEAQNMSVLYNANRASKGRRTARDKITLVGTYPDGSTITLGPGIISEGMPGKSIASAGRLKSATYTFVFQDYQETRGTQVTV